MLKNKDIVFLCYEEIRWVLGRKLSVIWSLMPSVWPLLVSPFLTQETPSGMSKIEDVAPATQHVVCFALGFRENKIFASSSHPSIAVRKSLVGKISN